MRSISSLVCASLVSLVLISCQSPQPTLPTNPTTPSVSSTAIPVGKAPHGIAAAAGFVYNSNSEQNTISVIDAQSNQVVATLTVPSGHPGYVKASHDGKYLLVVNPDAGQLHVYDPAQSHKLLQSVSVGKMPDLVVPSETAGKVWVSLAGETAIVELDFTQGFDKAPAQRKLTVGQTNVNDDHRALAVGKTVLAASNSRDNNVSLLDAASGRLQDIQAGNNPAVVGIGSLEGRDKVLLIGNSASHSVTLYDLESKEKVTLTDVGQTPTALVTVPSLERAFITMAGSNEVAVIDYRNRRLVGKIAVGNRPVHIYQAPESMQIQHEGHDHGAELWVGNDGGASVSLIDATALSVKATVAVGKGHHKMAFWGQKAFVSNITDNTVSAVDRNKITQ